MVKNPRVSVVMITYGHEHYIEQALDGVLMQKCDFNFEIIVSDDCSPDGTEDVVQSIMTNKDPENRIRYTRHSKNKGISDNFSWALAQARGEYIALCEGDDFWTDSEKLAKQVKFLDTNFDFGLVATNRSNYFQDTNELLEVEQHFEGDFKVYNSITVLNNCTIATLTTLIRKKYIDEYLALRKQNPGLGAFDFSIWLYISSRAKLAELRDNTATYRSHGSSITHMKNRADAWGLRRVYYKDFQIIKEYLLDVDKEILEKEEYGRARAFYTLAALNRDSECVEEFKVIFKKRGDIMRYLVISLIHRNRTLIRMVDKIETLLFILENRKEKRLKV